MNGRDASRVVVALAALALASAPNRARAADAAAAEALFREGRERLAAHDVEAACVKFAESERLDAMPGTLLNLAACHETEGRVATAWAEFVSASGLASSRGDAAQAEEGRRRAATLAPRLPRLTISMDASTPGAVVHRDDVELARGSLGVPLPVDPGSHRVAVVAPGYAPWTVELMVREGESQEIHVPALSPERMRSTPRTAVTSANATASGAEVSDARDRRLGWVIGGAGVAFAVTAGTLFAVSVSADHTAERGCGYQGSWACTPSALAAARERDTLSTLATVSGSVGVGGIAVGLWFLLHPPSAAKNEPRTGLSVFPEVSRTGSALVLRESFE